MKLRTIITIASVAIVVVAWGAWYYRTSLDGLPGTVIVTLWGGEDTLYASGYSDERFRGIQVGMTEETVETLLGPPLSKLWLYDQERPMSGCVVVDFKNEVVVDWVYRKECESLGIRVGMTMSEVETRLQQPAERVWIYSRSPNSGHYRERKIHVKNGVVNEKVAQWYVD